MKTSFLCSCTQPRNRNTVPPRAKSISGKLHSNDSLICSSSSALARKLLHLSIKNKISKRGIRRGKLRQTFPLNFLLEQSETGSDRSEICLELQQQWRSPQMSGGPSHASSARLKRSPATCTRWTTGADRARCTKARSCQTPHIQLPCSAALQTHFHKCLFLCKCFIFVRKMCFWSTTQIINLMLILITVPECRSLKGNEINFLH